MDSRAMRPWSGSRRHAIPGAGGEPATLRVVVKARSYNVARGWTPGVVLAARHERLEELESEGGGTPWPQIAIHGEEVVVAFALLERGAKPFGGREDVLLFTGHAGRWSARSWLITRSAIGKCDWPSTALASGSLPGVARPSTAAGSKRKS